MKTVPYLIGLYVALVLETVGIGTTVSGLEPGWLYLAAAIATWMFPPPIAVLWGGAIGLLLDGLSHTGLGLHVTTMGTFVWMAAMLKHRFRVQSLIGFFLLTFSIAAGTSAVIPLIHSVPIDPVAYDWKSWSLAAIAQGAATALTGVALFTLAATFLWLGKTLVITPFRRKPQPMQ